MWQKHLLYLQLPPKKLKAAAVTVNQIKVGLTKKYFVAASVAAMLATGASAATMSGAYGNGFNWEGEAGYLGEGVVFGPSVVFTTFLFDRGGEDFYLESFSVANTDPQNTGEYSFAGYRDASEIYSYGPVTVAAPQTPIIVESGEEFTAIDKLKITISEGRQFVPQNSGAIIVGVSVTDVELSAVPLPASVLLLGAGIAGLGAMRRRQKKA